MTIRFTLMLPAASLAASLAAAAPLTIADQGSFAADGTVIETTARLDEILAKASRVDQKSSAHFSR